MSNDELPATLEPANKHASRGRWWTSGLLLIVVVAALAAAVTLLPGSSSSRKMSADLTHTITRGDVIVTVTEQGTLESSDNTEIKCQVRGESTVIWVVEGGTEVQPGDDLVRLDTLALEDAISERTKFAHLTRAGAERAKADVAVAKLAISEYLEGTYREELIGMETNLAISESTLRSAQNQLDYTKMMAERGYAKQFDVETGTIRVTDARLRVELQKTQIDALKNYRRKMRLEELNGDLKAAEATYAAESERARMDAERRDLAIQELEYCVVKAERSGIVIYPSAAAWREVPEIEEGATVHKDQVLLLMPDLTKMQVKVGIHESIVDRVTPGLPAKVTLPDKSLDGEVTSVAAVTRPAGWWTGNVVKYDTIVKLPPGQGLKPGMTAEVEVTLARHEDVLRIPVVAVVETAEGDFCWVKTAEGIQRQTLQLGDNNDDFVVIQSGVEEGDEVVLDPLSFVEEAQTLVLTPLDMVQTPPTPETGERTSESPVPETEDVD
jgi:multidrug resistance efflux pump